MASFEETRLLRAKFSHLSDDQFQHLQIEARKRGLSLWGRSLYADARIGVSGRPELLIHLTIDGMRALAAGTKEYGGQTGPHWAGADGAWKEVWIGKDYPSFARVGVLRKGIEQPFYGIARWQSYVQWERQGSEMVVADFWNRMAPEQLAKCAEALALRRAFPEILGGLYSGDEMCQATNPPQPPMRYVAESQEDGPRFVPDPEFGPNHHSRRF